MSVKRTWATRFVRSRCAGLGSFWAERWSSFRPYSTDYVPEEAAAQEAKAGMWQGRFVRGTGERAYASYSKP